ncbi:sodium:proton antiporter [Pseudomonas sp. MGal98]|uniref:sodium:proton antiporter n=1 Tax=Pseudomonas sp. MGal98 TaxID=3162460 RepID=UPI0032EE6CC6
MTIALCWLGLIGLFALATWFGKRLGLIAIVSQLLLGTFALPVLLYWSTLLGVGAEQLLAPGWLRPLYGIAFSLLLAHILSDVIDLDLQAASLKIALPSFFVPFFCGLACALWLLPPLDSLTAIAIGLLFALTAIPVLFLYLQDLAYPAARTRTLMQAAILMDLLCWSIFALAQGSRDPSSLAWPLLAAASPLVLRLLGLRHAVLNGSLFLGLLLLLQQLGYNVLVFGIVYLLLAAGLRLPVRLPLPAKAFTALQTWLAVPLILAYGLLQIDWHGLAADFGFTATQFIALLALPALSKLAGSWLGLSWAAGGLGLSQSKWRESILLNTRGLTEIVFLNLLLHQQVISTQLYFALMLMGLLCTLLPATLRRSTKLEAKSRYEVS